MTGRKSKLDFDFYCRRRRGTACFRGGRSCDTCCLSFLPRPDLSAIFQRRIGYRSGRSVCLIAKTSKDCVIESHFNCETRGGKNGEDYSIDKRRGGKYMKKDGGEELYSASEGQPAATPAAAAALKLRVGVLD